MFLASSRLLSRRGSVVDGLRLLRNALNELRETGSGLYFTAFLSPFAEALAGVGDVTQGLAVIEEALAPYESNKELWCLAELLRRKGELLLLERRPRAAAGAEDHFAQALDVARRQGALSWELRAALSLARLWRDQGRSEDAYRLLAPVYDRFTEGFETADLRAAKALIDQLGAHSNGLAKAQWGQGVAGGAVAAQPRSPTNLPETVSELIGREVELSRVRDLVTTHRLVTLIGDGGIGKTRLGVEVARRLLPEFADGAWVAELAPLSDPELVPATVAASLGLNFTAGAISIERITNALGTKRLIFVLDNCEHVIGAAASIASALSHANPAIHVLATSREPLRAVGEHLYRVRPLAVPAEGSDDTNELLRHGAVELFVTRARAADPHFSTDGHTAAVAAAICRRLDGIPLAIELAAARSAALGIDELASRLDDRFHLLAGGHRTAPPRQQTLRATLDWSYGLLPESERAVLRRLAIFVASFGLEAASIVAVSAEITGSAVIDCVANLVTKSLVAADAGDATERYRLLDTTRAYALEKLTESGELASLALQHAQYYRDLFERASAEWLPDYKPRIANLRATLDWAFRQLEMRRWAWH